MSEFTDLHCHWLDGIDDGARSRDEGREMLERLRALGFRRVVATPHMRPGMFDNDAQTIQETFEQVTTALQPLGDAGEAPQGFRALDATLPWVGVSAEHYLDDVNVERIFVGKALPYPGGRAILLEFYDMNFNVNVEKMLFEIQRRGLLPVIAHPERYRPLWGHPERLQRLIELGSVALLDVAALTGKYGFRARRCARILLEKGLYHAACTDAHRPRDVEAAREGMSFVERKYGAEEVDYLMRLGPEAILAGKVPR